MNLIDEDLDWYAGKTFYTPTAITPGVAHKYCLYMITQLMMHMCEQQPSSNFNFAKLLSLEWHLQFVYTCFVDPQI